MKTAFIIGLLLALTASAAPRYQSPAVAGRSEKVITRAPAMMPRPAIASAIPAPMAAVPARGLTTEQVDALAAVYLRQAANLRILAFQFPEGAASLNGQALSFERAAEMLLEAAK